MSYDTRLKVPAERAVKEYLAVRPGEQVLVLVDTKTSPSIPEALFDAITSVGAEPILIMFAPRKTSGEDLPKSILEAAAAADVVISAASRSPYHSSLAGVVREAGNRGVLNSPPYESGWVEGAMQYHFSDLRPVAFALRDVLTEGSVAHVTAPNGTDITMSIAGRKAVGWKTGMATSPCDVVAWPGGEVSLPPVEGTASGVVIVNVAMTDIGGVHTPIEWTVENGLCVDIKGGEEADRLRALVETVEFATNIGELGIGINPGARLVDDITEAKKRRGTAHIALGDSANGYGGNVNCALHLDGLIPEVTIEVDGQDIVSNGVLAIGPDRTSAV